jgi:hypothetical protein
MRSPRSTSQTVRADWLSAHRDMTGRAGEPGDGTPGGHSIFPLQARHSHPSKSEHPHETYTMNQSRTRTGRIFERLAAIWQDTRYASRRLTAINRPWIAQRTSARAN